MPAISHGPTIELLGRWLKTPLRTAEAFVIEDLIDPRETRPYLCQFIAAMHGRLRSQLRPKRKRGVRAWYNRNVCFD